MPFPLRMALKSPRYLFAMKMPVFCFTLFWAFFMEGWSFAQHGINSLQNVPAIIVACAVYSFAVSSLASTVDLAFNRSRFALHCMALSALRCVFITGNLFPWQDIPVYMRAIAWFLPSTPGVDAILRASKAGAPLRDIFPYLLHLLFLGCSLFLIACLLAKRLNSRISKPMQ